MRNESHRAFRWCPDEFAAALLTTQPFFTPAPAFSQHVGYSAFRGP
jgi:hypothetical protein